MKKIISALLALIFVLSAMTAVPLASEAEAQTITIAPYETGMENFNGVTQLLICPKIAGNWTDDWGAQLENLVWSITFIHDGGSSGVEIKPSSVYYGGNWGILRFEICAGPEDNRFIPEKNVPYQLYVRARNNSDWLYSSADSDGTWMLTEDPIVPEIVDPDPVTASGDGWLLQNGVLRVTSGEPMGGENSEKSGYPWHSYRDAITEVVVGPGVQVVGRYAFDECKNLTSVEFGKDTDSFFNDCLARNPALKRIVFKCPAVYIGQGIVYLTNNLETVTLTGQTKEEFKTCAIRRAYNFEEYGGIRTGFDNAQFVELIDYSYSISGNVMTVSGENADVGYDGSAADDYKWAGMTSSVTSVVFEEGVRSIGAHALEGMPALEEIRVASSVKSIGDYAFSGIPTLKRIRFGAQPDDLGEGLTKGSTALSSVVIIDGDVALFRRTLAQKPFNLVSNGGVITGMDLAQIIAVYVDGVWPAYGELSAFGLDVKNKDVNKNGIVDIDDVAILLDFLASAASWAGNFYNVNNKGGTTINDVTELLNALSVDCGHSFEKLDEIPVTCTQDGRAACYVCRFCGGALNDAGIISAPGHTVVNDQAVPATCGSDGLSAGRHCSVCGEILAPQTVIPATGAHSFTDLPALEPTCGKDGYTAGRVCGVCGYASSGHEILPATGAHTPVTDQAVAETCLRSGLTEGSHCSVCGSVLTAQTVVSAAGHVYRNNRCLYCGKADYAVISGKSALFTGDSLCAASTFDTEHQWWGWARRISETYGLSRFDKTGADGASVSNCRGSNTIINQINGKQTRTYDYVVLEGGTNDGWDVVSVGSMTSGSAENADPSAFDLSTFAGGLENLFYYAKQYFPTAKIGYVFTHKMNSNTGSLRNMSAYLAMAKSICLKWNIPMLNIDESPDFAVKYFAGISSLVPDGIHPSSDGYEILYPVIARFMAEITLDGDYAIYTAEIETTTEGPEPYAPTPDRDEDPQGWIKWLQKDYGETTPMFESGRPYNVGYSDGQTHVSSPFEYWGGHYQFDYIFDANEIDLRNGVGTSRYCYIWELWYKDADVDEDYRVIRTKPWSVYTPSCIYRIDTYDEGMNDLHLDEGSNKNVYDLVIVIYDLSGTMIGWHKDSFNYSDSSELFLQDALNAGAIGQ